MRISRRHATVAIIAAFATLTVTTTTALRSSPNRPPAPPTLNSWQLAGNGDGLNRFVVQLADRTSATASPPSGDQLDVAALEAAQARYGTAGVLERDGDGSPVYVADGRSIPVGQRASALDPLEAIEATPGVDSAQRLPDGAVLVATKLSAAEIEALPSVKKVTVSPTGQFFTTEAPAPNDPYFGYEWFLKNTGWAYQQTATAGDDINALAAWPVTTGGGAVIADLDSGMANVPDLAAALWTNPNETCGSADTDGDGHAGDCHGWNFYRDNADVTNAGDNVHGTGVAGSIVATANNGIGIAGEAPGAKLMPLVIGAGHSVDMNLAIVAMYYAVDHGATVINCSFGGPADPYTVSRFKAAVDYAGAHGVLVVAAAGNSSADIDTSPMYPASLDDPYVLTVGATDANDNLASFSNYGANSVDLFAPGVNIATTGNDGSYVLMSGTSLSSPLVAAAIALEKSADASATPEQIRDRLLAALTPVPSLAGKGVHAGVLDVGNLVSGVHYHVTGLGALASGASVEPTVTIAGEAPSGPYGVTLRLATRYRGATYAVSGARVTVAGQAYTTDDSGSIAIAVTGSVASGIELSPSVRLPDGLYAWIVQLSARGTPVGRPAAAIFTVGNSAGSSGPAESAQPSGRSSGGSGSSTAGPTASGSSPARTTQPGGASTGPASKPSASATASARLGPTASSGQTASPSSGAGRTGGGAAVSVAPTATRGTSSGGSGSGGATSSAIATSPNATSGPAWSPTSGPAAGSASPHGSPSPNQPTNDSRAYAGTDPFEITGLTPATVSTDGGAMVMITGSRLPMYVAVLVGGQPAAVMAGNTTSYLIFFAPRAVAGSYDVAVFDVASDIGVVLPGALTYAQAGWKPQPGGGSSPAGPGGTASETSPPSGTSGGTPVGTSNGPSGGGASASTAPSPASSPVSRSTAGTPTSPTANPTATPPPAAPNPAPTSAPQAPVVVLDGLRLVGGDPTLAGLDDVWDNGVCATSGCEATPL